MNGTGLTAENVCHVYRSRGREVRAVDGVTVRFAPGELTALHGTSGAGKSTLLYLLGGLGRPTGGAICVDGTDLATLDEDGLARLHRDKVGFVFQSLYLMPTLTARENVELPLLPLRRPAPERAHQAEAALEQVGLAERAHHLPGELSGGEQQRVAIARALVMDPEIILADEPTSDLDRRTAEAVVDLLAEVNQRGCTVLLATHDLRILDRASRRIEMEDGHLVHDTAN